MLDVSCIDFEVLDDDIAYDFQVSFGKYRWQIRKNYADFAGVNKELLALYGAQQVPYLTGEVAFWNKTATATAEKRQPKLEGYLSQLINGAEEWQPAGLVVQVPHPDDSGRQKCVNKFVFDFLEFTNYKPAVGATPLVLAHDIDEAAVTNTTFAAMMEESKAAFAESEAARISTTEDPDSDWVTVDTAPPPEEPPSPVVTQSLVSAANITSQLRVSIRNFTIHPKDRIDYNVHVTLCGHSWQLPKRFSEFEAFHQELTTIYGAVSVPNLEGAKIPFWKKFDQSTGQMRQRFFEQFMREIIRDIEGWEPPLLVSLQLARKKADGNGVERVTVFVSKPLFDFFNFQDQTTKLSADMASEVVQQQRATLPSAIKQVLEQNKNAKMRQQIKSRLEKRQKQRGAMAAAELDDLCGFLSSLDDDKDVLNVVRWLVAHGWVNKDITALEQTRVAHVEAQGQQRREEMYGKKIGGGGKMGRKMTSGGDTSPNFHMMSTDVSPDLTPSTSPREAYPTGNSSRNFVMESAAPSNDTMKLGVSSAQLVQLSQAIFFDDTRRKAIELLASILRDDECIDEVLDTVVYEWEELRQRVDLVLAGAKPDVV